MVFHIRRGIAIVTLFIGELASIVLAIASDCLTIRLAITRPFLRFVLVGGILSFPELQDVILKERDDFQQFL